MKQRKRGKQFLSILLTAAIVAQPGICMGESKAKAANPYGLSNPVIKNGVTTWDTLTFGRYWQSDTNGDGKADQKDDKEPIRWRVLSVNGDEAFLLADKCLDAQPYNKEDVDVTWETCTLRKWLNEEFIQAAFTEAEQTSIPVIKVKNEKNPYNNVDGGNDTKDKVYLLSVGEVTNVAYGFGADFEEASDTRVSEHTEYAVGRGTYKWGGGYWWLRSPGIDRKNASMLVSGGCGHFYGNITNAYWAVKPALRLSLSSTLWTKGKTISSDGKEGRRISSDSEGKTNSQNMEITKEKAKIKSAKNVKGRKITIKLAKLSGAKGCQMKYATNKEFEKAKIKNSTKLTYTFKKLKKNQTYYIKARAYVLNDNQKIYSKWSTVKKVIVKK